MNIFKIILSLPKSIYFNMKVLPLKTAFKLPIIVEYRTKLYDLSSNTVEIKCTPKFGMIKYGWYKGPIGVNGEKQKSKWSVDKNSRVVFYGKADFANGISIRCDNGGIIKFGENFVCNSNCFFASNEGIEFGDNVLIGWNTNIRDVDGHSIYKLSNDKKILTNTPKKVIIGSHVWIAAYVDILKGARIPDETVVAYRACVTSQFKETNCIIGGFPADIIKKNIKWER